MRHAGGGRGRLAAKHHLPALHALQQAGRLVLAGMRTLGGWWCIYCVYKNSRFYGIAFDVETH